MPQSRIQTKLNKIAIDRQSIEEGLAMTSDELEVGANVIRTAVKLSSDPHTLYKFASDDYDGT